MLPSKTQLSSWAVPYFTEKAKANNNLTEYACDYIPLPQDTMSLAEGLGIPLAEILYIVSVVYFIRDRRKRSEEGSKRHINVALHTDLLSRPGLLHIGLFVM